MSFPYKGILIMSVAALLAATGQLFFKLAGGFMPSAYLVAGAFCYIIGALLMIYAYRFGKLSTLNPVLALGYVFALLLGALFLHEEISGLKVLAIILICVGVSLLGKEND